MTLRKNSKNTNTQDSGFKPPKSFEAQAKKDGLNLNAKKVFLLTIILIFPISIGLIFSEGWNRFKTRSFKKEFQIKTQSKTLTLNVEIADDPSEHSIGLMNRTELDEDKGMLFVFKDEQVRTFWMKNTLIPLDIIFIDKDGILKHIEKTTKPDQTEAIYSSSTPVRYVLEVNAGWCDRNGVKLKDEVILPNGL